MVGSSSIGQGERGSAEVFERCEPLAEDGTTRLVPLQVHSSDLAGPVVEVEVGGKFGVVRLQFILSAPALAALLFCPASGRSGLFFTASSGGPTWLRPLTSPRCINSATEVI